jgi:hypothetical protein
MVSGSGGGVMRLGIEAACVREVGLFLDISLAGPKHRSDFWHVKKKMAHQRACKYLTIHQLHQSTI